MRRANDREIKVGNEKGSDEMTERSRKTWPDGERSDLLKET